jgi:hypothetical protein
MKDIASTLDINEGSVHSVVYDILKSKAVLLHAMVALGGRGGIAPTHF